MPVTPSETRSTWQPRVVLQGYGAAVLSVAAAALLLKIVGPLSVSDTRPVLLVAVTISALYGGLDPVFWPYCLPD